MCGISGIVGRNPVSQALLDSIRNLEYRGYDSCGVAIVSGSELVIRKDVGSVDEVNGRMPLAPVEGCVGIAHTRWATHGEVTQANAHPHVSCEGDFALVHNGIIANYRHLREELASEGHRFRSSTDTETVVHLVEKYFRSMGSLERAFCKALGRLEGNYALALVSVHEPDRIYCARFESPLLIGTGPDTTALGSDFNAFLGFTRSAIILEDGQYAVLLPGRVLVKAIATRAAAPQTPIQVDWNVESAQKGGYPHFMLKEIHEQPQTVIRALDVDEAAIDALAAQIARHRRTYLVGVGTTYYVAQTAQYYFSSLAKAFIPVISSDEFRSLAHVDADTLVIAISQSGETYDTLDAVRFARERGARTAAICNVMGSSLTRLVDQAIIQGSGPEICVVSTKAALGQVVVLLRVAAALGRLRGEPDEAVARGLRALPDAIQQLLDERSDHIRVLARRHRHIQNWLFLGRGIYYPLALESALKMKEVTYLHAEGMPAGFLKHGTLSLIDRNFFTVILAPSKEDGPLYAATMGNAEEVKARGGFLIGTLAEDNGEVFDERIVLPKASQEAAPLLHLVALQLFAYFTAAALDRNVDRPRALAKSVTVG
jgi:glucosamine--fructose-6-phosphate aminotransferase (isomerizing)